MNKDVPVEYLPEEPVAPWWLEDIEDYLELLHGDADSLLDRHLEKKKSSSIIPENPKKCPGCKTVYHATKRGGSDTCPFCHHTLNFIIV